MSLNTYIFGGLLGALGGCVGVRHDVVRDGR